MNKINMPKIYFYNDKILDNNRKVTKRVLTGLENVLSAYTLYVPEYARVHDNNPRNFQIEKAYLIGSAVSQGRVDSDLDIMLIAPYIDEAAERDIKVWLNILFYNNIEKNKAIDPYVRSKDKFPEKPSYDITSQVKKLLKEYNKKLSSR